ncbi:MAG: DUF4392 domain-containing protein [Oscillospiraceae bacterium]|jgi:hypothetical protein|nr:DUF4392 domain-containing protein [Oscillospiraceae bacterium]
MTQAELTERNVGQNLDDLMNLDPRGYGVCRILYPASRGRAGEPVSTLFAKRLLDAVPAGGLVHIITGFVLLPHKRGEMDGIVGAALFARALNAIGRKAAIIVPEACVQAARALAAAVGLHSYPGVERALEYPHSVAVVAFPTGSALAEMAARDILDRRKPGAVVATEAAGANAMGCYHTALGLDVTDLEAKSEALFRLAQSENIPTFAIGDLGNEIGMGAFADHLDAYIPRAGRCLGRECIIADTSADVALTATVSDWGMNAVIAALAYLTETPALLHSAEIQREAMLAASRSGMVNMYGDLNPAIDGFDIDFNVTLLHLMRRLVESALGLRRTCAGWFSDVIARGFYDAVRHSSTLTGNP